MYFRQIEALRGTVRFLRTENSYLKGHDLLREIEALPALPKRSPRPPTPPLVASGNSDTGMSDSDEPPLPGYYEVLVATSGPPRRLGYRQTACHLDHPRSIARRLNPEDVDD